MQHIYSVAAVSDLVEYFQQQKNRFDILEHKICDAINLIKASFSLKK